MTKTRKTKFNPQEIIDKQVGEIDASIELIERRMRPYEELNAKKQQLLAARRALLGGSRLTGTGGTRLQLEDLLEYLKKNPGHSAGQMAMRFSVPQTTVSSHIYRNKDRFISKDGRYWVRDPENDINTADDIEEDDE
jgi:hypothetical protein